MEIESIGELGYACNENRLLLYKGFGEKTQSNIKETIEFYFKSQGSHLYAEIQSYVLAIDKQLQEAFPGKKSQLTGEWRRQLEIIDKLEWITTIDAASLQTFFEKNNFSTSSQDADKIIFKGPENIGLCFYPTTDAAFYEKLFNSSCSDEFRNSWEKEPTGDNIKSYSSEEEIFSAKHIHFIPPYLREKAYVIEKAKQADLPAVIQPGDIKSIIHSHSNWSDGSNTVEEMARACIEKGFQYLVISDHSKSAFYANGLTEERIREQHHYVDELNQKLSPFKIFKSIECDILNDGNLDYSDNILSTFDLVITSIHSNLKMSEDKAMLRLLRAIENPHTTILGHMTGRLLLSRPGYPVDHKKIIDACAANHVVIELNAHPRRLDIDWRWIDYAIEQNVMISIDPDAHSTEGYDDVQYGVLIAQKAGLTKEKNLSSFSLKQMEEFLSR